MDKSNDIQKPSIRVYKETSEDWSPSYELINGTKLVEVGFHYPLVTNTSYMVSVWGSDDCGMELQFTHRDEAMSCFITVVSMTSVTWDELEKLGFKRA